MPPLLMSSMMSSPQAGTWAGTNSQYGQGFGQNSPHTYPYMYGYRYPHYENSPYWYRGYPVQAPEAESETAPPPQPPA